MFVDRLELKKPKDLSLVYQALLPFILEHMTKALHFTGLKRRSTFILKHCAAEASVYWLIKDFMLHLLYLG